VTFSLSCPRCGRVFQPDTACPSCAWVPLVGIADTGFGVVEGEAHEPVRVRRCGVRPALWAR
jgi:hypothetical protein